MFLKADRAQRNASTSDQARGTASRASVPSIISADLRITGDLECSGDIQIDGVVNGDIQSRNIVIGEGASVTGSLKAEAVQVFGKLVGQIHADTVSLERTAHVVGDVLHKALAIAQGAFLEGACKRLDKPAAAPAATAETTEPAEPQASEPASELSDKKAAEAAKADKGQAETDKGSPDEESDAAPLQAAG
ncbi:MAG TPA: polymer-forming cytoskeletal protein [Terriglobia bacterium]|nr:polymer-forming cytoskeletal protein [Terriglobia bacterium]